MGATHFLRALIVVLPSSLGCESENESIEVTDSTDCSIIEDWQDQHECVYAKALMQVDDPQAMNAEISTLSEPTDQDMIFYRLAFNHPERAQEFCSQTQTRAFVEKCQQVLGRPHLGTKPRPKADHPQITDAVERSGDMANEP